MSDMKEALKVYDKIKTILIGSEEYSFQIYPYQNGRENGISILRTNEKDFTDNLVIVFSECRKSDDIVVYHETLYTNSDFFNKLFTGGFPLSDEAYENPSFFNIYDKYPKKHKSSKYYRAANFIKKLLTEKAVK